MENYLDRQGEGPESARVAKQLKDKDGRPIGTASKNPILDSRMYEVEYEDVHKVAMATLWTSSIINADISEADDTFDPESFYDNY